MILERRAIVFPRADFLDAMRRYGERIGKNMPDTAPSHLAFDPSQDISLVVGFPAAYANGDRKDFAFTREEVGQALQFYCQDHRVPLPKGATKQLEKFKDGCALMMQIGEQNLHIMIVDDQQVMRSIIRKLLVKMNPAQITEAADGGEALEMLRSGDCDPDVIICDLHMEKMGGAEFLSALRADKANVNRRKPVLILTGDKSEQAHEVTRQMGASKVLTKPIFADELIKQINLVRGHFDTK
jgi:two-component system chemotaxis response regulator CheY